MGNNEWRNGCRAPTQYPSTNTCRFVVEKSQAIACNPVNHSAERKRYAAAAQLKARSPDVQTYIYHAVDVARGIYDALAWFTAHPAADLHDSAGAVVTHSTTYCPACPAFDFTDELGPTPARWNAVIVDAIEEGGMLGC